MSIVYEGRILLVDDDPQVRSLLGQALRKNRFYVETAAHWGEAHTKLSTGGFDILLIDLHLPGIDGDRYVSAIRQTRAGHDFKIIIFSNDERETLARRAMLAGANGYLSKSEPISAFLKKLRANLPHSAPDMRVKYMIRSPEGEVMGPVSHHLLADLIQAGKILAHDKVATEGGGWMPVKSFPELAKYCN